MNGIRSFIAIELPEDVKATLGKIETSLKSKAVPAKWVAPDSIHLTLCFLGEISPGQVEAVKGVMTSVAMKPPAFTLALAAAGAFPDLRRPQTVWVGLQGNLEALSYLHKELEEALRLTGYKPEARPFRPHLTIARLRDEATPQARGELGKAIGLLPPVSGEIPATAISLMKSTLLPAGPVYTRLYLAKLKAI